MTLENYTERYLPLVTLNTVTELIKPVILVEEKKLKKYIKQFDKMHYNLSKTILEDQGRGSIF
jgi:hypothetical protein